MNTKHTHSKIVTPTNDGWPTLYVPEIDETYHSHFGARTESQHVFIHYGLDFCANTQDVCVFEVGFGTGLNAFESCKWARKHKQKITYYSIEKHILQNKEIEQLHLENQLNKNEYDTFLSIHACNWDTPHEIHDFFTLHKIHGDMCTYKNLPKNIDVVFFDAFSPEKQSELWSSHVFEKLYEQMKKGGVLTTYCVKGHVKRRLQDIGFSIEKLPGPKNGKREVLRAQKKNCILQI
ncbi:MAG: tRNA (5-methylaminomethyl-2-thiouridine)(34)-methyltransferase MnmD [Bacteroidales bacterium]|jgi:tRNA U34 5-methylaminomethyl-2-thiouridine-forming methyltransferase MnmC|nr:tRNA (5-methylaminomethyl-2-thiouridine)(34)-methyltransferase MnmD [Bacteroidales bacterium]NLK81188.1 tRNA (5-methylaminomethyl-2-thiouridine)(34)-methyltransferase MnmD [Bacteroidales bacterium]